MSRSLKEQMRGVGPVTPTVTPRDPWDQRLVRVAGIMLIVAVPATVAIFAIMLPSSALPEPRPRESAPVIILTFPPHPTFPPYPIPPAIQQVELVPTDIPPPPSPKVKPTPYPVCATGIPDGTVCEWPRATSLPLPTRTPVPRCVTPIAGERCEIGPTPVTGWRRK